MLFILTGNIQIGKTRWLLKTTSALVAQGASVEGLITPGIWEEHMMPDGGKTFTKLGIDALLLPQNERFAFARCKTKMPDVGVKAQEALDTQSNQLLSQSAQAGLKWDISDAAIEHINEHFDALVSQKTCKNVPRLLVVDEFGPLELVKNGGLTSAVRMIENGPSEQFPHALIIVREALCSLAHTRFAHAWSGKITDVSPSQETYEMLNRALFT